MAEELQQPTSESPAVVAEALAEIKTQLARLEDLVQDYLALVRVGHIQPDVGGPGGGGADLGDRVPDPGGRPGGYAPGGRTRDARAGGRACGDVTAGRAEPGAERAGGYAQGGTLTLTGRRTPTQVQLQVQDTGSGIAVAALAQIFEPLYTTKPGGTGLGLYLVHEIVTAHGGQITVASVEGQGATFTVTLPVMPAGAPAGPGC